MLLVNEPFQNICLRRSNISINYVCIQMDTNKNPFVVCICGNDAIGLSKYRSNICKCMRNADKKLFIFGLHIKFECRQNICVIYLFSENEKKVCTVALQIYLALP